MVVDGEWLEAWEASDTVEEDRVNGLDIAVDRLNGLEDAVGGVGTGDGLMDWEVIGG